MLTIGKRIRERRLQLDIIQRRLALTVGLSPQLLCAIEMDKRNLHLDTAAKLAEELGVTVCYIATGEDEVTVDTIRAIKADKKLPVKIKIALVKLVETLYRDYIHGN